MKKSLIQLLLVFLVAQNNNLYADLAPKPVQRVRLMFYKNNHLVTRVDSLYVVKYCKYGCIDTFIANDTTNYWRKHRYNLKELKSNANGYQFGFSSIVSSFQVFRIEDGKKYSSELIKYCQGNCLYKFDITEGVENISPLLRCDWSKYLLALLLTLILEFLILRLTLRKQWVQLEKEDLIRNFLILNVSTHFTLWFVYSHIVINIIILEVIVIIVESTFWNKYQKISLGKSIWLSFVSNITSWILGWVIFTIILSLLNQNDISM